MFKQLFLYHSNLVKMVPIQRSVGNYLKSKQSSSVLRIAFSSGAVPPKAPSASSKSINSDNKLDTSVPGLSTKVLNVPSTATGPGASKSGSYKNPEYFSYNSVSYFEAEIEMAKYRLPQPRAK